MSDSVALVRQSDGKPITSQRRELLKALSSALVHYTDKVILERWFRGYATVTTGSTIEAALNRIQLVVPIW